MFRFRDTVTEMGGVNKVKLAGALAMLLVVAAYANSFGNSFHFDDFHTITDNPAVRSMRNVPRFFTDATTFSVLPANRTYRPVVSTSLALDYALGRGYEPPVWFHLSTFCWFAVLLWLLFRLYRTMFARMGVETAAGTWLALGSAAWFGLHPVMAETVNYVIQRGDLYCTLGCVAALVILADSPQRRSNGLYLLPLVLALLSKPPAAVFPVLLGLWVYFFESGERPRAARWKRSVLAAVPSAGVVALLLALQSAMTPKSFTPSILSAADYRLTQPFVWLRYCAALFLPIHLNVDTDLSPFTELNGRALLGLAFLLALGVAIWKAARRRELYPVAFGLLWFVVTQLPTSLYPLSEVENDHRMFFSFAGLIPAVVWAGWLLLQRWVAPEAQRRLRPVLLGAVVLALLGYAWGTHRRNAVWHDEESLWRDDAAKSPHNGRGLMIYGLTQMNKGAYPEALDLFTRALRYTPNYATLEINIGVVNGLLGNKAEAEQHFQRAVLLEPNDDSTHTYYGRWLLAEGRPAEAVEQLRTAVALNPQRVMQRGLLIQALRADGDAEGAKQAAAQMTAAFPSEAGAAAAALAAPVGQDAAVWINRSLAQYRAGAYADSVVSARKALELNPNSAAAYNNLGAAYGALRQWAEAVKDEKQALALDPTLGIAKNNLAAFESANAHGDEVPGDAQGGENAADLVNKSLVLNQQGKFAESIEAAQAALRVDPRSAEAWNNIAANYESLHAWDQAIDAAEKAVALRPDFQLAKNNLAWSEEQKRLGVK